MTAVRSVAVLVLTAWTYVAFEWLFFATKPSLLQYLSMAARFQVLAAAPLALILVGIGLGFIPLLAVALRPGRRWQQVWLGLALLFPAFLAAGTLLLLVENFTYTVFGFTVMSETSLLRALYGIVFAVALARILVKLAQWAPAGGFAIRQGSTKLAAVLLSVSLAAAALSGSGPESPVQPAGGTAGTRPDIFLIGIDGVTASHLSAFGYVRRTTPFLDRWMKEAVVFENAFTNAGSTTGSITSLLTGRLPMHTRVIYRPDALTGAAAYRHLPGLLRGAGYRSISLGVRHHADPLDLNLVNAFHRAIGGRSDTLRSALNSLGLPALCGEYAALFLQESGERLLGRVGHLSGIARGANWFEDVRDRAARRNVSDDDRVAELQRFVADQPGPVFAHVHFMDSHGSMPVVTTRKFGKRTSRREPWNIDDYDDAIRDFDRRFEKLVAWLKSARRYHDSIIIVYSDHGPRWSAQQRLPLMIRWPGGTTRGKRRDNVQLADVAPTLVSYLGLPVPEWMDGQSLLGSPFARQRVTYFALPVGGKPAPGGATALNLKPPFYTLAGVGLIVCDRSIILSLKTGATRSGRVPGHTRPCQRAPIGPNEGRRRLVELLRDSGYDVSAIPSG